MSRQAVWLIGLLVCVPGLALAQERGGPQPQLPAGEGQELAQRVCTTCHPAVTVLLKRDGEMGWRRNVERMIVQKGAQVTPEELETLIRYLSTRLGPGLGRMETTGVLPPGALAGAGAAAKDLQLPAGPGKEVVEQRCGLCHDLGRVASVRRTSKEWNSITRNMLGRGPQPPAGQLETILAYLTSNFGKESGY